MPNALAHRVGAAIAMATVIASEDEKNCQKTSRPIAAACIAAVCGTLPDVLEPALHPNHRQFFHSLVAAGLVGFTWYRLYRWEPSTPAEKLVRLLLLAASGAFLTHLVMDVSSPKGLPLLGRI